MSPVVGAAGQRRLRTRASPRRRFRPSAAAVPPTPLCRKLPQLLREPLERLANVDPTHVDGLLRCATVFNSFWHDPDDVQIVDRVVE